MMDSQHAGLSWWCVAQVSSVKLNAQLAELTALVRSPLEETARRKVAHSSQPPCCDKNILNSRTITRSCRHVGSVT